MIKTTCKNEIRSNTSFSRRTLFRASASAAIASTFGAGLAAPALAQGRQKIFVLVHGAWHGGWCWRDVRSIIEAEGHRVYVPTLTGLAEHSHLLTSEVDLNTHITDISNLFHWFDLEDVTLVAHSYAGWVCSGALENVEQQVASLVLVDAFMPEDGTSAYDTNNAEQQAQLDELRSKGIIARPAPTAAFFGVKTQANIDWVNSKTTPQPVAAAFTTINLSGARERVKKKLYVRAEGFAQPAFTANYEAAKADPSWNSHRVSANLSGHDIMVDAPELMAQLILDAAI